MIKSINEREPNKIEIDLTGPDGNAFSLIGYAENLSKQLNFDFKEIRTKMISSDYDNLVKVFDEYFGDYVILYR
jgi:hypothetical protein